ncbi:MAG: methyltransferase domain-containing protein [Pseudomonadota bacterium]
MHPRWSAPGTRGVEEVGEILAYRRARALREYTARIEGSETYRCPICGYEGPFAPKAHKPSVWCPQCDSRPRHRLLHLWMARQMVLPPGARVLHFAAEPWVGPYLSARGAHYTTADLNDRFDLQLDITAMDLPDGAYDMVIANHVLEHVDDRAALAETARILTPGGQAVLTVPLVAGWAETYEGAHLDAPARAQRLGDADHQRFYGADFRTRFAQAGFTVTTFAATEPDVSTHALQRGESIFIGRKPPSGLPSADAKGDSNG